MTASDAPRIVESSISIGAYESITYSAYPMVQCLNVPPSLSSLK
jgi:hypothetical protein